MEMCPWSLTVVLSIIFSAFGMQKVFTYDFSCFCYCPLWKHGFWLAPWGYYAWEILVLYSLLVYDAHNLLEHKTLIGTWT